MTHIVADRVCETTVTTGTGNVTLAGAVAGFQTFAAAMANGDTFFYCIEDVDTNGVPDGDWEVGEGTYVSATPAIARTTVLESSNADAAVNFAAGTKRVMVVHPAEGVQTINDLTEDTVPVIDADFLVFWDTSAGTSDKVKPKDLRNQLWAAGSATALSWPLLGSGTLLTTPEKGAFEHDTNCLYFTTDVGNRGVVPVEHIIRCDSARTLPNDTNTNAIFNSPANGRITLETGVYLFEMLLLVTAMSATSGNAFLDIKGAGTATIAAWLWRQAAIDAVAAGTLLDDDVQLMTGSASAVVTATTGTVMRVWAQGTFEVTAAGTLIPSIDLVTAVATASVNIGSYFSCRRVGSTTMASVGQWD